VQAHTVGEKVGGLLEWIGHGDGFSTVRR
jgi:hypothetical protein